MTNLGRLKYHIESLIRTYKNNEQEVHSLREQLQQIDNILNLINRQNIANITDDNLNNIYSLLKKLFDENTADYIRDNINMVKIFIDDFNENEPQIESIKNGYERIKKLLKNKRAIIFSDISRLENRINTVNPNLQRYLSYITDDSLTGDISEEEFKDLLNIVKYTDFDEKIKIELISSFGKYMMDVRQKRLEALNKKDEMSKAKPVAKTELPKIENIKETKEEELTIEEIKKVAEYLLFLSKYNNLPNQELNIITSMSGLVYEGNIEDALGLSNKYSIEDIKKYNLVKKLIEQMTEYSTIRSMKKEYYLPEVGGNEKYQRDIKEIIDKIRSTLSELDNIKQQKLEDTSLPEDTNDINGVKDKNIVIYLTNSGNNQSYVIEDQEEIIANQKLVMKKIGDFIKQLKTRDIVQGKREYTDNQRINALSPYYLSSGSSDARGMLVYIEVSVSNEVRDKISEAYDLENKFKVYLVVGTGIKSDKKHNELNNRMNKEISNILGIINLFTKNIDRQSTEELTKIIDEGYKISTSITTNSLEVLNTKRGESK